jgi:hypothetical protein
MLGAAADLGSGLGLLRTRVRARVPKSTQPGSGSRLIGWMPRIPQLPPRLGGQAVRMLTSAARVVLVAEQHVANVGNRYKSAVPSAACRDWYANLLSPTTNNFHGLQAALAADCALQSGSASTRPIRCRWSRGPDLH